VFGSVLDARRSHDGEDDGPCAYALNGDSTLIRMPAVNPSASVSDVPGADERRANIGFLQKAACRIAGNQRERAAVLIPQSW
jgi:hypothetical protein